MCFPSGIVLYPEEMVQLIISDVGPITQTAKIEFERFCILIGPQSNGKSTIAKILSTCQWIEKEACTTLQEKFIKNGDDFKKLVEDFHRMHNYIHEDQSVIEYHSPYINIVYNKGNFAISFNDNLSYRRKKISYIPSDRNVVTMKDIEKRDLEPTNFRSFLFDWLETNRHFDESHRMPILNLGVEYYYDSNAKDRNDKLTHANGLSYTIPLYDASSGMQSMVPMIVLMHYLVSGYIENYGKDISFDQQQKEVELAWKITECVTAKYYPQQDPSANYRKVYSEMIKSKADINDPDAMKIIGEMKGLFDNFVHPKTMSFILEEPEQNIFPKTQVDLFNDIISTCNFGTQSSAFITTHSPYLLASANILLFAGKLVDLGIDEEAIAKIVDTHKFIHEHEFSAYTVSGGTCHSIIDDNTHLIKENELDSASEYNNDVFQQLYRLYTNKLS